MHYLNRIVLSVALMTIPLAGTGCSTLTRQHKVPVPQMSGQVTGLRRYQKLEAARREEDRGNLEEAKRLYTAIHNDDPKNAECCHHLALIYTKLDRHNEAEVFYRQATAIMPNNPRLLADRGYSAFLRKDYLQAEEWLEQSTKLDLHNHISINGSSAVLNLAIVRAWQNKDDSSLATFRLINNEVEARRNLAAIQMARGDKTLGLQNEQLAQNLQRDLTPIAETKVENPLPPSPNAGSRLIDASPSLALTSEPSAVASNPEEENEVVPAPASLAEALNPIHESASIVPDEIIFAPLAKSSELKQVLVSTCVRPMIAMASCPMPVTAIGIEASHFSVVVYRKNTDVAAVPVTNSSEQKESLEFELPMKIVFEEENSDELPAPTESAELDKSQGVPATDALPWDEEVPIRLDQLTTAQDFSEFCLVNLRDDRRIVKGQREFPVEYHGQKFLFSSAEAQQKFRIEPERYAPAAGGLDLVQFRNEREVIQGCLKFAIWYRRCLYVFGTQENREMFQQNPEIYLVKQ